LACWSRIDAKTAQGFAQCREATHGDRLAIDAGRLCARVNALADPDELAVIDQLLQHAAYLL